MHDTAALLCQKTGCFLFSGLILRSNSPIQAFGGHNPLEPNGGQIRMAAFTANFRAINEAIYETINMIPMLLKIAPIQTFMRAGSGILAFGRFHDFLKSAVSQV